MKKILLTFTFLGITLISLIADETTRYVSVETVALKDSTWFFAKTTDELVYGQEIKVIEDKSKWLFVVLKTNSAIKGWIPSSSTTTKKIVTRSGTSVSTSADELALAGKGFNKEVEDAYKENNVVNYDEVDKMESYAVDMEELKNFIIEGNLEGAQQ